MYRKRYRSIRIAVLFMLFVAFTMPVSSTPQIVTVGFVQDNMANDWRRNQVVELKQALEKYADVRFVYADAKGSAARQVMETENMIDSGIDILIASPQDSKLMAPVLKKANAHKIPVILLTRIVEGASYTTFISPDDYSIASDSADFIATRLNNKGRVIMIRGLPTATTAKLRTRGFIERMKKYPDIQIVKTIDGNYLRQDTMRAMEDLLNKGIEFDAIYAQSDSMAAGARLVMAQFGIDAKKKIVVGIDYIKEAKSAILSGEQTATFTYPACSKEAAGVVRKLIDGKEVEKRIKVPSRMITSKNVKTIQPLF